MSDEKRLVLRFILVGYHVVGCVVSDVSRDCAAFILHDP
jgi:hypothetical protein